MKKIINGKLYDTDTAREIDSWANRMDVRDWHYFRETLYRKKTGEYFLHGEGGPMTHYAERVEQNGWRGSERIVPLTWDAAREWAEAHMDADDYQAEFGEVAEDDSTYALHAVIPAALGEKLRRAASQRGQSITDVLIGLLSDL